MSDLKRLVEQEMDRAGTPAFGLGEVKTRRDRKRRNQRIGAGAVGVAIVVAVAWFGVAVSRSAHTVPADHTSPSPTPSPSAQPKTFTSQTYGYSLTLPKGWIAIQASAPWDGNGSPAFDDVVADQFTGLTPADVWAFAAPTTKPLGAYVRLTITGTLKDHGEDCPAGPVAQHPIQIGRHPGMLLEWDCGLLINQAVAVHNGVGYFFGLRDPSVKAARNAGDRKLFLGLLDSVHFAD